MKTVLLCGGEGTRLKELTESIPKPMVEIGGKPILWHIMKMYSHFGFNNFILCLGYKGEKITEHFEPLQEEMGWNITFADTGAKTPTGGRILKIKKYIEDDVFFANYGDGLADIDLNKLLEFHKSHNKVATITTVKPLCQFGILKMDDNRITSFIEKPPLKDWVNGGFFVFHKKIFDYLEDNLMLEREPFERLANEGEVYAYKLDKFWKCMDTYKDMEVLNKMWASKEAPWHMWK